MQEVAVRRDGGIALVIGTTLFVALYAARVLYTGRTTYGFLLWNLALAWAPWLLAQLAAWPRAHRIVAWSAAIAWFFFLPNAPYIVTDFVHLRARPPAPLWYDVAVLGTAALVGLVAGGLSLRTMHRWIADRLGSRWALGLVALAAPASGFGIYLGRFERHNSWDLVTRPWNVLADLPALSHDPRALVVTAVFAGLTVVSYVAVGGRFSAGATPRTARSTPPPTR